MRARRVSGGIFLMSAGGRLALLLLHYGEDSIFGMRRLAAAFLDAYATLINLKRQFKGTDAVICAARQIKTRLRAIHRPARRAK